MIHDPPDQEDPENTIPDAKIASGPSHAGSTDQEGIDETIVDSSEGPSSIRTPAIDNYEILDELGRGGMGVVYRARQVSLNRTVALKMILSGVHASPQARQRFLREAEAVARLRHPNIIHIFDMGHRDGLAYFAMEFVEGQDLQKSERPTPRVAAEIVEQLALAIEYAHGEGVIHRDLKPANVLLDETGTPRITDFGLAKLVDQDEEALELTGQGQLMGTAAYMPPEQAAGDAKNVTEKADIYSLGAILYHLLTDQPPFIGRSTLDVLKKVQHVEPFAPGRLAASVPSDLETICLKCLEKDPAKRFDSAQTLADDLRRFLDGRPIQSRRITPIERCWRLVQRSTTAKLVVFAILALVVFGGMRLRHYLRFERPTESYFRQFALRRGDIIGLHPVAAEIQDGLSAYFRLVRRGSQGPPIRIEALDAGENPVAAQALSSRFQANARDFTKFTIVRWEIQRDANDAVSRFVAFDRSGTEVWSFVYTKFPSRGHFVDQYGTERTGAGSSASYLQFDYLPDGKLESTRFLDRGGLPAPNSDGVFGYQELEWDDWQPTLSAHLDADGNHTTVNGFVYTKSKYKDGLLTELTCLDENRMPTNCSNGHVRVTFEYDPVGNLVEEQYWGPDGERVATQGGYSRIASEFKNGRLLCQRYFNANDHLTPSKELAAAEVQHDYNPQGLSVRTAYFDAQHRPTWTADGYASVEWDYDDRGNIVSTCYFGVDGASTTNKRGIHRMDSVFDGDGQRTEIAYYGVDDAPINNDENWSRVINQFDPAGNITSQEYFDANGERALRTDGYSRWEGKYNSQGNVIEERYLDPDDNLTIAEGGFAIAKAKYNEFGKAEEFWLYDASGNPTTNAEGWHYRLSVFNDRGFETGHKYFDAQRQPTWHRDGYASVIYNLDDFGNPIQEEFLDPDGKRTIIKDGYAVEKLRYDRAGHLVEQSFFDIEMKPVTSAFWKAAKVVMEVDGHGRWTNQVSYDTSMEPISGSTSKYSPRGELVEVAYHNGRGQPVLQDGIAKVVSKFDDRGNMVERTFFGIDGEKTLGSDGICQVQTSYDDRGNPTSEAYFDRVGAPTYSFSSGHARVDMQYDAAGNVTQRSFYDVTGKPFMHPTLGVSIQRKKYDQFGQLIEESFFDTDGQPALYEGTSHKTRMEYERGNVVETAVFGTDGKPLLLREGYFRFTSEYDALGNEIERRLYDTNGKPPSRLSYFRISRKFDHRGNAIETAWYNAEGELAVDASGYSIDRSEYDALDRLTATEYFDAQDQPVMAQPEGFFRLERQEDIHGNEIRRRYLDTENRPVVTTAGFAERIAQVDPFGRVFAVTYLDADEKPVDVRVQIPMIEESGVAEKLGLRAGDILERIDDVPINDGSVFVYHRATSRGGNRVTVNRDGEQLQFNLPPGVLGISLENIFPESE